VLVAMAGAQTAEHVHAVGPGKAIAELAVGLAYGAIGGQRGARLGRAAVVLVGWFGPRGLASVVFALLALEEISQPACRQPGSSAGHPQPQGPARIQLTGGSPGPPAAACRGWDAVADRFRQVRRPLSPARDEPLRGRPGLNYRMVLIFGAGPGHPEDLGEVAPCVCPNCHNQVFLHHVRSKKSVRLYFVPVVPYGTDDYLVCPVCSRGLQLSSAQLRYVRSMSGATASFRAGRLTQAGYMAQAEQFWRQLGVNPAGQQPVTPASPGAAAPPAVPVQSPAPAQSPPVAADDQTSWISQLRKLAELHDQGVLSDAAYSAAKQRILEQKMEP
jgi:hypothetical protein